MINIKLNKGKSIYFSSDNHLGAPNYSDSLIREKLFISWLDKIKKDAQVIFLLGDLFDFWFEYYKSVPKGFTRVLGKLAELSDSGIKIYFFVGNHDYWTRDYFQKEIGMEVLKKPTEFKINNKVFFIGHGDGLGPGDFKYKFLKRIFRNPLFIFLFRINYPWFGIPLGNFFSRKNKILSGNNIKFKSKENEILYHFCKKKLNVKHYDFFVFGHRHLPLKIELGNNSYYFNTGDWINHYSFLHFKDDSLQLKYFKN
jgi:UDP-2,3-diacylglucosamine hydrolase|tara:strand:+ start:1791 stop:2555 length:765 start_codon:yes stop_codon:yes gene_type:complete